MSTSTAGPDDRSPQTDDERDFNERLASIERCVPHMADVGGIWPRDVEFLLSALRSARRDVARLRDSLTWALNELRDGLDGPAHFCEFDSNPEKGACDFCEAWATARLLASSPPILEKNDRG